MLTFYEIAFMVGLNSGIHYKMMKMSFILNEYYIVLFPVRSGSMPIFKVYKILYLSNENRYLQIKMKLNPAQSVHTNATLIRTQFFIINKKCGQ